jgi:hypothetical protein
MLDQLSAVITTRKTGREEVFKIFPTFDFTCPQTIKSWGVLRLLLLDYGQDYHTRSLVNISAFLMISIGQILYIGLIVLRLMPQKNPNDYLVFIMFGMDLVYVGFFVLNVLFKGLQQNLAIREHRKLLMAIRDILEDLRRFTKTYFGPQADPPINFIYKTAVAKLTERHGGAAVDFKEMRKKIKRDLTKAADICTELIDKLTYLEENEPYSVLGIPTTPKTFAAAIWGLFTVAFAGFSRIAGLL